MILTDAQIERAESLPRKPWRRRTILTIIVILIALAGIEYLASRAIASKLRGLVANKLDAELKLGTIFYIPPYGAWIRDAQLVRKEQPLVRIPQATVKLAEFPLGGEKPLIISSLRVTKPVLQLAPDAFKGMAHGGGETKPPKKLSEMLRLEKVRISDGRITYADPAISAPPMVWDNITIEADTTQQSTSGYKLRVVSRAAPFADASASGTIDVDSLLLDLQSVTVKLKAEPEPTRSPVPQQIQEFLKKYRVNGALTVSGSGKVPLRDPQQGSCNLTVDLQNAIAMVPDVDLPIDHVRANITCTKRPGGPVLVKIDQFDAAGDGKEIVIQSGNIELDTVAGTWKVADVEGFVTAERPLNPATQPKLKFNRYEFSGRADLAASASGPFQLAGRDPWETIKHEIVLYPRGASFLPKDFAHRIEDIAKGEVRLADGMIVFQEMEGTYGGDRLRLRSARLPVKGLPKLQQWQEISGTVFFHQPIRRYSPKVDRILDALNPEGAFLIAGSFTNEKLSDDERKRSYDLIVSSDSGNLEVAKIPFKKIRGDATITPAGVELHGVQADALGGTMMATGRWQRGGMDSYDGDVTIRDVELAQLQEIVLARAGNVPEKPLRGRMYAQATVFGTIPDQEKMKALRASGEFEVVDGDLFRLPVLKEIFGNVKGLRQAATVGDAAAVFDIADGNIKLRDAAVSAPVLGLQGSGTVSLDGKLDLTVIAAPLADWRDKLKATRVPIVSDVAGQVAGGIQKILNAATGTLLYQFRVEGDVKKAVVTTVPTPVLTDAAAFVFERMLAPKKDQRPLDWFRREPSRAASRE